MPLEEAPVRSCCGRRHFGVQCPDGTVMCCLCFERFGVDQLSERDGVKENVCLGCAAAEKEMMAHMHNVFEDPRRIE